MEHIKPREAMPEPGPLGDATQAEVTAALDALWTTEAQDRLAAYLRGEVGAIPLSEVLSK